MLLKGVGLQALSEAIEKDLACARHFEKLVENSEDFEMLSPGRALDFLFSPSACAIEGALATASPSERGTIEEQLDAHNERLLLALQRDGSSYLSNARLRDRFSLRGCVMNYRTTRHDMEILLDDLRRIAAGPEVAAEPARGAARANRCGRNPIGREASPQASQTPAA